MGNSGTRIVVEDAAGQLHALCKIQTLADGGYALICPYHAAREGWLFKLPIGLGYGPKSGAWLSVEDAVHYTASDRVKLSHHRDGLVQFSSETKGKIRSGVNPLGLPRGIGVRSIPIDDGISTGPACGVSAWGIDDFDKVENQRKTDFVFSQSEMRDFLCDEDAANGGYSLEVWLLHGGWRGEIQGTTDNERILLGGTSMQGQQDTLELRVIRLRGTNSFLGVHVQRMHHRFPGQSGFLLGGSRSRSGEQIVATYPRPSLSYTDATSLDYSPNTSE